MNSLRTYPRTQDLVYWITERDMVRQARAAGLPAPWSADPVFQTTRFCNVRREDDTVTQWIRQHWNNPADPAWKYVLGRMINLPSSLTALIGVKDLAVAGSILKTLRARGDKVFTSAYTISTCGKSMDKIDYVIDHVCRAVEQADAEYTWAQHHDNCEAMYRWLMQFDGLGSFLAAQVVADMKNTGHHPLKKAPDWYTFAAPGPGSLRGLEAFWGRRITSIDFQNALAGAWVLVQPHLPPALQDLHMQDLQNCFCEFSKYVRVSEGDGRARNKVCYTQ